MTTENPPELETEAKAYACGLYITTLGRSKRPYIIASTPDYDVAIAQLLVDEDEFWKLLGDALGLEFFDAPEEKEYESNDNS